MVMKLDEVAPFGRSLDEYRRMFLLSEADLAKRIVGLGDGPASFNAEMAAAGRRAVSVDPLYVFSGEEIARRFRAVVDGIIAQVEATPADWVWTYHRSPERLRRNRERALELFLADYPRGKKEGRYLAGELPRLDRPAGGFDLALCSHFLFLYSDSCPYEFHLEAALEMLRLAPEARIFPLLTLGLERSPHLEPLRRALEKRGFASEVCRVDYELQRGGDEMLRLWAERRA